MTVVDDAERSPVGDGDSSPSKPQLRRRRVVARLMVWIIFGVVFGLLPLEANSVQELFSDKGFVLSGVLGSGELFVVSAVLSAGAIGELLAGFAAVRSTAAIIMAGFCLMCLVGNVMAYMQADHASISLIAKASLILFSPTLISSGICVGTAALHD